MRRNLCVGLNLQVNDNRFTEANSKRTYACPSISYTGLTNEKMMVIQGPISRGNNAEFYGQRDHNQTEQYAENPNGLKTPHRRHAITDETLRAVLQLHDQPSTTRGSPPLDNRTVRWREYRHVDGQLRQRAFATCRTCNPGPWRRNPRNGSSSSNHARAGVDIPK